MIFTDNDFKTANIYIYIYAYKIYLYSMQVYILSNIENIGNITRGDKNNKSNTWKSKI